jgi:hypothetical protein
MKPDNENELSQSDRKRQAVIVATIRLFTELLAAHYAELCDGACEEAERVGTDPKVSAKFCIEWNPLATAPKLVARIGWTSTHKDCADAVVDPDQLRFPQFEASDRSAAK